MKTKYYLDTFFLGAMVILSILIFPNIEQWQNLLIFGSFLLVSIIINWRFRIVLKYPVEGRMTFFENADYVVMIIGKLFYLLLMTSFFIDETEMEPSTTLFIFIFQMLSFMGINYITKDALILHFSKVIKLSQIVSYDLKKHALEYYFCHLTLNNGKVLKVYLSQDAYMKVKNR